MYDVSLTTSFFPAQTDAGIYDVTVGELLREISAGHPEAVAMVEIDEAGDAGQKWIYSNLLAISERLARSLASRFAPCLLYTSPSPRDATLSRMPSSA